MMNFSNIHIRQRIMSGLLLLCGLLISCSMQSDNVLSKFDSITILPADELDKQDVKWADYLVSHLVKRVKDPAVLGAKDGTHMEVLVDNATSMGRGAAWDWKGNRLTLHAGDREAMLWLVYQLISALGQDNERIEVADLPPVVADLGRDGEIPFCFEYRSIYAPSNKNIDLMPILGSGNIDFDWGIWGHNLGKVLGDNLPETVYAFDGAKRDRSQFCFSSDELYKRLEAYILNDWGDGAKSGGTRFVIMPNDNAVVCQCDLCKAAGNRPTSATPALSAFIERMAKRFPNHEFFTSSYASAKEAPNRKLPANVGVIISAMDLPYQAGIATSKEAAEFKQLLGRWRNAVGRIYVWDYMRNFDDYFSPYPFLRIARERLQWYREQKIDGVIFNGSGDDYASFDDMQTYVLAALMVNPDEEVEPLVRQYFSRYYPATGAALADYYLTLEDRAIKSANGIPYYGGIEDEMNAYLKPEEFRSFFNDLDKASKKITGDERKRVSRLLTAFNYTLLEMMRTPSMAFNNNDMQVWLENLSGANELKDMANYREANGSLVQYLSDYSLQLPVISRKSAFKCTNVPKLTDGYVGLASDYHTNWVVSADKQLTLRFDGARADKAITVGCLEAPVWHIYLPATIELWQNGKKVEVADKPQAPMSSTPDTHKRWLFEIKAAKLKAGVPFELRLTAPAMTGKVTMAVDEVY